MNLGEEDLIVLMKILVNNIAEGSQDHNIEVTRQVAQGNPTFWALEVFRILIMSKYLEFQLHWLFELVG